VGLRPADLTVGIHAFRRPKEDVDTRDEPAQDDLTLFTDEFERGSPEARFSPDSPALSRE